VPHLQLWGGQQMERKDIFKSHIVKHRIGYMAGFALLSISCLMQLLIPMLLGKFTDQLKIGMMTVEEAVQYALWMVVIAVGVGLFRALSRIYVYRLSRLLEMKVRGELFQHWERLSATYFSNTRIGDLMSHAISDVGVVREVTILWRHSC
jgi:ATP-binding cassette subfamily B multidrug efflux pump